MTELSNTELDNIDEVMNDIMEKKTFIEHSYSTYREAKGRDKQDLSLIHI